jgi:hypothetical protein
LRIIFTNSNLEEGIFGGTITSNFVVTWKTVAVTSFCKTAPAIGVEIMGVTEPMAFMSPVSEPTKRCQQIEGGTLDNKQQHSNYCTLIHILYSTHCWINVIIISIIHIAVCLMTGPKPLPKQAFHIGHSRASSLK